MLIPVPPRGPEEPHGQEAPAPFAPVVRLKVTLLEIVPPVWRRFRAPANLTLRRLHAVLQKVMGWNESPLHQFRVGDELFGMPSENSEAVKDSRWITLQDLLSLGTRTFSYEYRLGDRWAHLVRIESVSNGDQSNQRPLCLAGERPCPPAGCGGPDAYIETLDAWRDPRRAAGSHFLEPLDPNFDPEDFDLDGINAALAALRF